MSFDEIFIATLPSDRQPCLKISIKVLSSSTDPIIRILGSDISPKNSSLSLSLPFYHKWTFYERSRISDSPNPWILTYFPDSYFTPRSVRYNITTTGYFAMKRNENEKLPMGFGIYASKLSPDKAYVCVDVFLV